MPGRRNIVLTRQTGFAAEGCVVANSVESAIALAPDSSEVMVIGGGIVYASFLPLATRIYLTRVHAQIDGDAFFPPLDRAVWNVTEEEESSDQDGLPLTYQVLERAKAAQQST